MANPAAHMVLKPLSRPLLFAVIACVLAGLIARVFAAQGGLWIDEAWSAIFADEAVPVLGVLASIHHDNNHHLNTIWLQLTGMGAPSPVMRGLSIISGTASIWIAAMIGARRDGWTAVATAALFALSPILVLYGSEARGYAPMLLCLLASILLVLDALDAPEMPFPANALAGLAALGTLAHLMMAPALLVVTAWVLLIFMRRVGFRPALSASLARMGPALFATGLVVAVIIGSAHMLAGGMTVGSVTPFSSALFTHAMGELISLTGGIGYYGGVSLAGWGILFLLVLLARRAKVFFLLLLIAMPLAVILVQPVNSQFSRYYLLSAIGILMLAGDSVGALLARGPVWRGVGVALLAAFAVTATLQIIQMHAVGRGHPDRPVALLKAAFPKGATILLDHHRAQAVLAVSARQANYAVTLVAGQCKPADALFIERERNSPRATHITRCNQSWRAIGHDDTIGPSGQNWSLYEPDSTTP